MMRGIWLGVGLFVVGCRGEGLGGVLEGREARYAVGFLEAGGLAVFDIDTGAVQSVAQGGGGTPRDVSVDGTGRVWVYEENEEASGGEIFTCASAGPCEHAAWVDGGAALAPRAEGVWVFEDGPAGPRWKVLASGQVAKGTHAPRPASIVEDGEGITALSYGLEGDMLEIHRAEVQEDGAITIDTAAIEGFAGFSGTARLTEASGERRFLWDVRGGELRGAALQGTNLEPWRDLGVRAETLEAAAGRKDELTLVSANVAWIAAIDGEGSPRIVAEIALEGRFRRAEPFFTRDLLFVEGRALVATDRGVRAITVEKQGEDARAFLDERFEGDALRGPLAPLPLMR